MMNRRPKQKKQKQKKQRQKSKKRILRAVSVSGSTQDFLCYNHENMNFKKNKNNVLTI